MFSLIVFGLAIWLSGFRTGLLYAVWSKHKHTTNTPDSWEDFIGPLKYVGKEFPENKN